MRATRLSRNQRQAINSTLKPWLRLCPFFCAVCASLSMSLSPAHAQSMSDEVIPGAPLMVEVMPLQQAVPVAIPLPMPDIELNLQPSTDYGPNNMAWDSADDGQTFRRQTKDKTIKLLLYGVADTGQGEGVQDSNLPKVSRNLKQFMDGHFASIKKDYLTPDNPEAMRLVAGDPSFISESMTRGMAQKPAKLAGVTVPVGPVTVGGGYTWGESNPALMQTAKRGLIVGASYKIGKVPVQVSYLSAGHDVAGVSMGGKDPYDSVMFGASYTIKERWTVNSTMQYRNDRNRDLYEDEQKQVVITIGTKLKF